MKQPEWQRGGICGALSSTSQQLNLEPSEQREREKVDFTNFKVDFIDIKVDFTNFKVDFTNFKVGKTKRKNPQSGTRKLP